MTTINASRVGELGVLLPTRYHSMKCIKCEKEARAICKFCGRAVCEDHFSSSKFFSGFVTVIFAPGQSALLVEDAVWCEICEPKYRNEGAA